MPPPIQVQTSQSGGKQAKAVRAPSPSSEQTISKSNPAPVKQTASIPQPELNPQLALSLSSRLEVIASHEDLSQALIALNSWCGMTPNSAPLFFQHDCYANEIILQRFIVDPSLIHQSQIRSQFITFLASLLPPPSFKSHEGTLQCDHILTIVNALIGLLDQVSLLLNLNLFLCLGISNIIFEIIHSIVIPWFSIKILSSRASSRTIYS